MATVVDVGRWIWGTRVIWLVFVSLAKRPSKIWPNGGIKFGQIAEFNNLFVSLHPIINVLLWK